MEKFPVSKERSEAKEYEPSSETVAKFLNLTEEELETFKQRLGKSQGHLRIWVHPLYAEQWPTSISGRLGDADLSEVQNKLKTAFFKTISSVAGNLNSSPLVVYEMKGDVKETSNLIASHLKSGTEELAKLGIIFIPTSAASNQIDSQYLIKTLQSGDESDRNEANKFIRYEEIIDNYDAVSKQKREETHKMFPKLKVNLGASLTEEERVAHVNLIIKQNMFMEQVYKNLSETFRASAIKRDKFMISLYRNLGLQSALVSGAYLEVGEDYETKKSSLQACAGEVVNMLREANFSTDISNNIWPPKELVRAAGFKVKETGDNLKS